MFTDELNKLKKIFDTIERYDPSNNIGMRSIKNLGVWLCVYALADEQSKEHVIRELARKSGTQNETDELKKLADTLSRPEVLKEIIGDYLKANGSFALTTNTTANRERLERSIIAKHYDFLLKHVQVNPSQEQILALQMENSIQFNWAAAYAAQDLKAAELVDASATFLGQEMAYLFASSQQQQVEYGIVEHNNTLFHVVRLGTLQKSNAEKPVRTNAYLIESVDPQDARCLQRDYFEIINSVKKSNFNHLQTYRYIEQHARKGNFTWGNSHPTNPERNEYSFTVLFPKIASRLKTTEERLGVYEYFKDKTVADMELTSLKYSGKRELAYDKSGGEVTNRERAGGSACLSERYIISIVYAVMNPFMMIYEAQEGADYYPYFIANPSKDLDLLFAAKETYSAQPKVQGFASQGKSLFTSVVSEVQSGVEAPRP